MVSRFTTSNSIAVRSLLIPQKNCNCLTTHWDCVFRLLQLQNLHRNDCKYLTTHWDRVFRYLQLHRNYASVEIFFGLALKIQSFPAGKCSLWLSAKSVHLSMYEFVSKGRIWFVLFFFILELRSMITLTRNKCYTNVRSSALRSYIEGCAISDWYQ